MQFPRMLYRRSSQGHVVIDGSPFETLAVSDVAALEAALDEGWREVEDALAQHPLDHDGDGTKGGSLPDAVAPRKRGRVRK